MGSRARLWYDVLMLHDMTPAERAQDAYAIYLANSGGLNYEGKPCPAWYDLPLDIRRHWTTVMLYFGPPDGELHIGVAQLERARSALRQMGHDDAEVERRLQIFIVYCHNGSELKP